MATGLFHKLFEDATRKDCARIQQLGALADNFGYEMPILRTYLVDELLELTTEFVESMERATRLVSPRRAKAITYECPYCHRKICLNAAMMVMIQAKHIKPKHGK